MYQLQIENASLTKFFLYFEMLIFFTFEANLTSNAPKLSLIIKMSAIIQYFK